MANLGRLRQKSKYRKMPLRPDLNPRARASPAVVPFGFPFWLSVDGWKKQAAGHQPITILHPCPF